MNKHKGLIHSTTNYDLFVLVEGNRPITRDRVEYWKRKLAERNLCANFPLLVKPHYSKFQIFEGQGRFNACKELGLPIYYTVREDLKIEDIPEMQPRSVWRLQDYLNSWCDRGNEHYINLRRFVGENGIPIVCAIQILNNSLAGGAAARERFTAGKFKIAAWGDAHHIAAILTAIKKHSPVYKDRSYVVSAIRLHRTGVFDVPRFVKKLEYQPRLLVKCALWEQALAVIDEIYNFNCRPSQVIGLPAEVKKQRAPEEEERKAA